MEGSDNFIHPESCSPVNADLGFLADPEEEVHGLRGVLPKSVLRQAQPHPPRKLFSPTSASLKIFWKSVPDRENF